MEYLPSLGKIVAGKRSRSPVPSGMRVRRYGERRDRPRYAFGNNFLRLRVHDHAPEIMFRGTVITVQDTYAQQQ